MRRWRRACASNFTVTAASRISSAAGSAGRCERGAWHQVRVTTDLPGGVVIGRARVGLGFRTWFARSRRALRRQSEAGGHALSITTILEGALIEREFSRYSNRDDGQADSGDMRQGVAVVLCRMFLFYDDLSLSSLTIGAGVVGFPGGPDEGFSWSPGGPIAMRLSRSYTPWRARSAPQAPLASPAPRLADASRVAAPRPLRMRRQARHFNPVADTVLGALSPRHGQTTPLLSDRLGIPECAR